MSIKSKFEIREIYLYELEKQLEVAQLYCQIWQEPPWNEHFWTPDEVMADIQKEMNPLRAATMFMATTRDGGCVGFTWGYEVFMDDLCEISGTHALDKIVRGQKTFYIDELGVKSIVRNQGIGQRLSLALVDRAREIGCTRIILRTDVKARAARAVYAKLGFKEIGVRDAQYKRRTYWLKEI